MRGFGKKTGPSQMRPRALEEFRLDLPLDAAYWACRHAVARLGLEVEAVAATRIVARRGAWGFGRRAAKIELWLFRDHRRGGTTVTLDGRIFGRGSRWRRYLKGELLRLRTAVEAAA